jgi:general bacterial porin, GBP family
MKNLLPFVLIGALLSSVTGSARAQSSVTVYGLASVETLRVTGFNAGTVTAPTIVSQYRLDNSKVTNSRLGFRGVEDLGGGLKAVFDLESAIAIDTGSAANASKFWNRGSYVGLAGSFGSVLLGRQWDIEDEIMAPYFIGAGYAVFQYTEFLYISDLVDNAVKYTSPTIGGVKLQALVAPGEGAAGRTTEIGATYKLEGLNVGGTFRTSKDLLGRTNRQTGIGASYLFGTVRVHAGWASSDMKAAGLLKATAYDVGVAWQASPFVIATLDYVPRDQKGTDNDSHFVRLQADYSFSKRTSVFANIVQLKNKGTASEKFYGSGAPGQNQNVFSLGIRNWF